MARWFLFNSSKQNVLITYEWFKWQKPSRVSIQIWDYKCLILENCTKLSQKSQSWTAHPHIHGLFKDQYHLTFKKKEKSYEKLWKFWRWCLIGLKSLKKWRAWQNCCHAAVETAPARARRLLVQAENSPVATLSGSPSFFDPIGLSSWENIPVATCKISSSQKLPLNLVQFQCGYIKKL